MTISSDQNRWSFPNNTGVSSFVYGNKIFAETDLKVYVDSVLQTVNTDYIVTGVGSEAGGSIVLNAPPAGSFSVVIVRDVPKTQGTDLPFGGVFPAAAIEDVFDKITVLSQQNSDRIDRTLVLADTDPDSIGTLPDKASRSSKFLGFDAAGEPIASAGSIDGLFVSAFGQTLVDDDNAGAARTTLGLGTAAVENVGTSGANVSKLDGANVWSGQQVFQSVPVIQPSSGLAQGTLQRLDTHGDNQWVGIILFQGKDDSGNTLNTAQIGGFVDQDANGSENTTFRILTTQAGSWAERVYFGAGAVIGAPTGGDQGVGTINVTAFHLNGGNIMVDDISGHIDDPEADTYNIVLDAKYPFTIEEMTVKTQVGSCNCALKIDGVAVTGISVVAANTAENTYTATDADTVATGADVILELTTLSTPDDLMFTIKIIRTG